MPLKHTLLGLLQWQPMHGYLLRQHAKEYAWIYPMANASIYPALHSLEKEGFIDHKPEIHNGRARKVYEITAAGQQELRQWLISGADQRPSFRDQMLLKIAMQSDETMPEARAWLEETLTEVEAELADHLEMAENIPQVSKYAQLALEYGGELISLRTRFLKKVLASSEVSNRGAISRRAEDTQRSISA